MSALPIDASELGAAPAARADGAGGLSPRPRPQLVLVKGPARHLAPRQAPRAATRCPDDSRDRNDRSPAATALGVAVAPAPLRLTRRGRLVVGAALAIAAAAAVALAIVTASLVIVTASGGAQASDHGQARGGYAGMREIVVRPGQTLWSIASAAEPSADPRVVVQEIMSVNSLTSAQIQAGQVLWVPR